MPESFSMKPVVLPGECDLSKVAHFPPENFLRSDATTYLSRKIPKTFFPESFPINIFNNMPLSNYHYI